MSYTIEEINEGKRNGRAVIRFRIADAEDNAVASTYDRANAFLLKNALDAYGMSSRQAIQRYG